MSPTYSLIIRSGTYNVKWKGDYLLDNAYRYVYTSDMKNQHAVALGRKGGTARAKNLTAKQRSEGARKAVLARWRKEKAKTA